MMTFITTPLFSYPCVVTNIGRSFTKEEADCIANIPMTRQIFNEWEDETNFNHRSNDVFLFDNFSETLKDIKKFCEYNLKQYLEEIEGTDTELVSLRITQSWLNKTKSNESHHSHFHLNSYVSGVLYLKCLPKDSIVFENRLHGIYNNMEFPKKKITAWNASGFRQPVIEGDLLMFPSWILHSVDVNKTKDKERISLSFDTFPMGKMGNVLATQLIL